MPTSLACFRVDSTDGAVRGTVTDSTLDALSPGDVIIRAAYSSVNYKDALAATGAGKIIRRFPLIGGIDVAGVVESSSDARFAAGDEVIVTGFNLGVAHDGGYAEYVRVPADWVVRLPAGLSLFESMALGTAGFTAALSIVRLEQNGLRPGAGRVVVAGATGGVGSVAVACLARLGYAVTAITGKADAGDYLAALGAGDVLVRGAFEMGTRPLEKPQWMAAVDPVGGSMTAWLTRTVDYGGSIALSGLTGGTDLAMTVMPFILRGVNLLGIDSVMCPMPLRTAVWQRLAGDMKPASLGQVPTEIALAGLPDAFATLLRGDARGRFVVRLGPAA